LDLDSALKEVITEDDQYEYGSRGVFIVHRDFRVVVCSHFKVDDYEEFLARALPLDKLQAILVTGDD